VRDRVAYRDVLAVLRRARSLTAQLLRDPPLVAPAAGLSG
jgi:hypothetical protein